MATPQEIFDEKFENFEALEGNILPATIDFRYKELRFAHANANSNFYPTAGSEIDRQLKRALKEAHERSVFEAIRCFSEKIEEEDSSNNTSVLLSPDDIMIEVQKLLARVDELKTPTEERPICLNADNIWFSRLQLIVSPDWHLKNQGSQMAQSLISLAWHQNAPRYQLRF